MYITRVEGNPEPVANPLTAINMDHLDKDCGRTRHRPLLFVVQPNSELISRRYPPNDVIDSLPRRDLASELSTGEEFGGAVQPSDRLNLLRLLSALSHFRYVSVTYPRKEICLISLLSISTSF